jgi:hypothetical protein
MPEWTPENILRMLTNPFYCINIAEELCAEHEPMVTEEQWIAAATKLIKESGPETFLKHLLENLKGNYKASGEDEHLNN